MGRLRLFLALAFVVAGLDKFTGAMWVKVFNDIDLGQWFHYFTGVVEILGRCLLLVPRATAPWPFTMLVCTMAGAIFVHLTVVGIWSSDRCRQRSHRRVGRPLVLASTLAQSQSLILNP